MKKIFAAVLLLTLIVPSFGKTSYSFFKPDKAGKTVKIQVSGKSWNYCLLDRRSPLELSVEGPAKLKVLSRLDMSDYKSSQKVDYTIQCIIDGNRTHYTHSALISKGVHFGASKKGQIGEGQEFVLDVPAGNHKIKLYVERKDKSVIYARVLKQKRTVSSGTHTVAIFPQKLTKQVKILVNEKEFDYFRVGGSDSLSLKVIGPTSVKTFSRLEYDVTMNGEKKYRVQVYEDGKLKNTFLLNTILSETAVYKEGNAKKIISRGDSFYMEVPAGEHTYTFKVLDSGRSALLKFYIPEKALKLSK